MTHASFRKLFRFLDWFVDMSQCMMLEAELKATFSVHTRLFTFLIVLSDTIIFDIYIFRIEMYMITYGCEWSRTFEEIFSINLEFFKCFKHSIKRACHLKSFQVVSVQYMNRSIPDLITYAKVKRISFAEPLGMFAMVSCFL